MIDKINPNYKRIVLFTLMLLFPAFTLLFYEFSGTNLAYVLIEADYDVEELMMFAAILIVPLMIVLNQYKKIYFYESTFVYQRGGIKVELPFFYLDKLEIEYKN